MEETKVYPLFRKQFYESKYDAELETDFTITFKYHTLLHLRHDLVHYLVNEAMLQPQVFLQHRTLRLYYEDYLPEEMLKLSPDIFLQSPAGVFFLDVSCSVNRPYHLAEKTQKYQPVLDCLSQHIEVLPFYFFWVHPSWHNLESELESLYSYSAQHGIPYVRLSKNLLDRYFTFFEEVSAELANMKFFVPKGHLMDQELERPLSSTLTAQEADHYCKTGFEHWDVLNSSLNRDCTMEAENIFNTLASDPDVIAKLEDVKHNPEVYERSFGKLYELEKSYPKSDIKPTFFIPYASHNSCVSKFLEGFSPSSSFPTLKKEQSQCLQFLRASLTVLPQNSSKATFLSSLLGDLESCLTHPGELSIFNTGMLTGNIDEEIKLNRLFKEHSYRNDTSISKRTFFKNMVGEKSGIKDTLPYIYKNKCIKLPTESYRHSEFVKRSATSYRKTHEVRQYKEKTSIRLNGFQELEKFMDLLETPEENPYTTHPFLGSVSGPDDINAMKIKRMFFDKQREFLSKLQQTQAHSFSRHSSFVASQLLHFGELNTTDNTFYLMTAGRLNTLHVVQGGSRCRGDDVGQAYFTMFFTHDLRWANEVYGNVEVIKFKECGEQLYLCTTPWVRLTSERLNFMKDQYYSTLSTAYDSWARNRDLAYFKTLLRHIYTFRVCVSLAPSQKIAELLMDTRYIFMSALSDYTNIELLILDKFSPPYKNVMEQFIVRQLRKKCLEVFNYLNLNPPKPNLPGYSGTKRLLTSMGGKIAIPSLWSNLILTDMQSIFDEIFVYVHTSKEPSSEHHEQVKAINTILKYQIEYDSLDKVMQSGLASVDDLKRWILSGKHVGCSAVVIKGASEDFSNHYKGLYKTSSFIEKVLQEPLSNMTSTKACIPELNRKVDTVEHTKRRMEQIIRNIGSLNTIIHPDNIKHTFFKLNTVMDDTLLIVSNTNRVKVHDAMLDWLDRKNCSKQNYVMDLAHWNITENNCRVTADTCIKAQYGAKREFYVVNLGAKAMMRVTENSYKQLAKSCPFEMISVPGDKKFEHIQHSVNESLLASSRRQDHLSYVNGDCTKWSACETMSSFIAMNLGLSKVFGDQVTQFNNVAFCSWANKTIQIPSTILANLRFVSKQTEYITKDAVIHSTQNFLQGMCNNSSSVKAVIATEFAIKMFRKNYPEKYLNCCHLEHSDDYSLVVRTKNSNDFQLFRVYHKLAQKLFGINDSVKKTNIQPHILEFISLFSFNGQLYYPNIKKLKEVGTNLSCTDFRSDAMSIISRVSEAVRLSISLESCYFMQRVHCCTVADAYSITPGMKNGFNTVFDCFNRPLELFGLPDILPVLSSVVKGNQENYRLYNFSPDHHMKQKLLGLYKLGQSAYTSLDLPSNFKEDLGEFYSPTFSYPVKHNKIKAIRDSLSYTWEEAQSFFDRNITDSLVKPVDTLRFKGWLKSMYYNKSFSKAYTKMSRASTSLRHSMFSSKPCILSISDVESESEKVFLTVSEYLKEIDALLLGKDYVFTSKELKNFSKTICCYNTSLKLFYDQLKISKLLEVDFVNYPTTVSKIPSPFSWIDLENSAPIILQYLIDPENFISDRRRFVSDVSIARDVERLSKHFCIPLLPVSKSYCRQVFKEIMSQGTNRAYGLVFNPYNLDTVSYAVQFIQHGLFYNRTFKFVPTQDIEIADFQGIMPLFIQDHKTNLDTYTGVLHQLALLYRTFYLRCEQKQQNDNLSLLLETKLTFVEMTVRDFLTKLTLDDLVSYNIGEQGQKIFSFLKSKLLNSSHDLLSFVKSKFYYKCQYVHKDSVLQPFCEEANIQFLSMNFKAYRYKSEFDDRIFLSTPSVNKVAWFYCYSIAERVFGKIKQSQLDERLMEARDFKISMIPDRLLEPLSALKLSRGGTMFYRLHGNVIRETTDFLKANLPIVTQTFNFFPKYGSTNTFDSVVNVSVEGLSAVVGNITVFKLPFGNLRCSNFLDMTSPTLQDITVDNVCIKVLLQDDRLMKFLKNEHNLFFDPSEIASNIGPSWKGFSKDIRKRAKLTTLKSMFLPETTVVYSSLEFQDARYKSRKKDDVGDLVDVAPFLIDHFSADMIEVEPPAASSLVLESLGATDLDESLAIGKVFHTTSTSLSEEVRSIHRNFVDDIAKYTRIKSRLDGGEDETIKVKLVKMLEQTTKNILGDWEDAKRHNIDVSEYQDTLDIIMSEQDVELLEQPTGDNVSMEQLDFEILEPIEDIAADLRDSIAKRDRMKKKLSDSDKGIKVIKQKTYDSMVKVLGMCIEDICKLLEKVPTNAFIGFTKIETPLAVQRQDFLEEKSPVVEEAKQSLLSQVPINFSNVDTVENVELDFDFNAFDFGSGNMPDENRLFRLKSLQDYSDILVEFSEHKRSLPTTLNEERDVMTLSNLLPDQFEELFLPLNEIDQVDNSSSSSSDNSEPSNVRFFQLVSQEAMSQTTWNYDARARENLLPVNDFLITCWAKADIHSIMDNPAELAVLLRALVLISKHKNEISFPSDVKAALKVTIKLLGDIMSGSRGIWRFSNNRGVTFKDGKIVFKALRFCDNMELAKKKATSNPKIGIVDFQNVKTEETWLCMDMHVKDLDSFITDHRAWGISCTTPFTQILSKFLIRASNLDTELVGSYEF